MTIPDRIHALWQDHNGGRPLHGESLIAFVELAMGKLCQARLGMRKSARKAESSAANGRKGGRPRKELAAESSTRPEPRESGANAPDRKRSA
jgi:hypothetical protein